MYRTHKIRLKSTPTQIKYFNKAAGVARFVYNWGLAEWELQYEFNKQFPHLISKPSFFNLDKYFNSIKHKEYPFVTEVTKCAAQEALKNLGEAFKNFFTGKAKYPRFKKKGVHDSFKLNSENFAIRKRENSYKQEIRIPNLGWVKMSEKLRFTGKLISATITRTANHWYAAITVDTIEPEKLPSNNKIIGVDLRLNRFVTDNLTKYILPVPYAQAQQRLKRLQQAFSRKKKGSKNRYKLRMKIAILHAKIVNKRKDFLHKFTWKLISENQVISIEDLKLQELLKNKRVSKRLNDASFYEFRRQLEYKAPMYGRTLIIADQLYASSKICHKCLNKTIQKVGLYSQYWTCENCHSKHDCAENAAINLKQYAVGSTVTASGELLTTV